MKKIRFETSMGFCYGTVIDKVVQLDAASEEILKKLYIYEKVYLSPSLDWVLIELDDGYYGTPEYRYSGWR